MDSFIQQSSENFTNFLSLIDLKANSKTTINYLLGYGVELDSFDIYNNLDRIIKGFEKSFFYEKPETGFAILAFDDLAAVSTEGKERFATVHKKILSYKNNFYNNWPKLGLKEVPVFLGGAKFSPEQAAELWDNFPDSYWFIPYNLLLKQNNRIYYIHYNLVSNKSNKEELAANYSSKLKKIKDLPASGNYSAPKMAAIKGNTPKEKKKWIAAVKEAVKSLENDELSKVVLSRSVEVKTAGDYNLNYALNRLREENGECYIFAYHSGQSTFIGASPEKLARFDDYSVEIDAIAGSVKRGKTAEEDKIFEDELLNSSKDRIEHGLVLSYVVNSLKKISEQVEFEPVPLIKKLKNIQHLKVTVSAKLLEGISVFDVIETVYPTPAICGAPKEKALAVIKKLEDYKRGLYSGLIGWLNFSGEGEFVVALRSALLKGEKLTAFAGCGIVADSNPEKEFEESELKLKTIMSLFENEIKNK
jgi:menaquinone-specific isochorismate synthase